MTQCRLVDVYQRVRNILPYFSIDNARVIYKKRSKFVKNEHARYTLGMKKGKNLERLITATAKTSLKL